jgi:phosphopantetheinyl transferase
MYLNEHEQALCKGDTRLMTLAWCAKEAVYKWNGRRGIDFIHQMPIREIVNNSQGINLELNLIYEGREWLFRPECAVDEDFVLSVAVKER